MASAGFCGDEVPYGLSLSEVQLAVGKSSLGKLTRSRENCSRREERFQSFRGNVGRSVKPKFNHIFARK
jgi:hypothetical protein